MLATPESVKVGRLDGQLTQMRATWWTSATAAACVETLRRSATHNDCASTGMR